MPFQAAHRPEPGLQPPVICLLGEQADRAKGPGPPAGQGEPRMGLPPGPRGTGRPGSASFGVDGVGDLEEGQNRPRAAADRADLGAVPAFSGRGDPGLRLPACPSWSRAWAPPSPTCSAPTTYHLNQTTSLGPDQAPDHPGHRSTGHDHAAATIPPGGQLAAADAAAARLTAARQHLSRRIRYAPRACQAPTPTRASWHAPAIPWR